MKKLFTKTSRPYLEYTNIIWFAKYRNAELIEMIQRRAIKSSQCTLPREAKNHDIAHNVPYPERLRIMKLLSLCCRKACGAMIEVFKLPTQKDNVIKFYRIRCKCYT